MCETCWVEHGRPTDWNPDIARAVHLIRVIYTTQPLGAPLHVVLDDWNIEGNIEPWPDQMPGGQYPVAQEAADAAIELCALFNRMSVRERAAALAYHRGYAAVPEGAEPGVPN